MAAHQEFFNQHKPKSTEGIFKHILAQIETDGQGAIAYDLCCGTGQLTAQLSDHAYQAYGIDISTNFIGRDGQAAEGFVVADVNILPFADASAELITFVDSLQYFEDPQATLNEIARLLKANGRLVLSSQNNYNPAGIKKWLMQRITHKAWSPWLVHPVENFILYPDLLRMLDKAGFEIEYQRGKQFLTAWVSLLPAFIRNFSPWKDKPWRSLGSWAARKSLPQKIEESSFLRYAMIILLTAKKRP